MQCKVDDTFGVSREFSIFAAQARVYVTFNMLRKLANEVRVLEKLFQYISKHPYFDNEKRIIDRNFKIRSVFMQWRT